jgi:hypothetical protein
MLHAEQIRLPEGAVKFKRMLYLHTVCVDQQFIGYLRGWKRTLIEILNKMHELSEVSKETHTTSSLKRKVMRNC